MCFVLCDKLLKGIDILKTKKRNWAFILYPESAPSNWMEILQQTGLLVSISPLHDKDLDPNKEVKKPHYHIILCYSGPTSYNVVKKITDSLNAPIPISLEAVRGYYRYFIHKDNPDKYQYNENEIINLNGFNIKDFVELTSSEVNVIKKELQIIIRQNHIFEYSDLLNFLLDNNFDNFWDVASKHTYFFNTYITSFRNKLKQEIESNYRKLLKDKDIEYKDIK